MHDPLASLPLSAIRVFEAAARRLSFTAAAQELGMTQAAVSWQVKALEQRLDQPLFRRLPREVALTPAGERLARAATEAVTALRGAVADIVDTGEGVLTLSTMQTLAERWLAPRLGAFQVAHPQIAVRVDTDTRVRDLLRGEADVAIRSSRGITDPTLEALYLFPAAQSALASPEAMARLGPAATPADLLAAPRVGADAEWAAWFRNAGVEADGGRSEGSRLAADNQVLEMAAAEASGGVGIGSPIMFAAGIAAGRLFQPFEVYIRDEVGYWLVYPKDRRRARKIAAFRDWLLDQVAADPVAQRLLAQQGRLRPEPEAGAPRSEA
jgi:LysR family glycine cleavage system transcriptional activator